MVHADCIEGGSYCAVVAYISKYPIACEMSILTHKYYRRTEIHRSLFVRKDLGTRASASYPIQRHQQI